MNDEINNKAADLDIPEKNREQSEAGMELYKPIEDKPVSMQMLDPQMVVDRYNMVKDVMDAVMKEGVHYGKPYKGGTKNVLLKPGGEALKVVFQLSDTCEVRVINHDNGHREYRVTTSLTHYPSGTYLGQGEGSCSTLESKYRYRNVDEPTEVPVSKAFWDIKNDESISEDKRKEQYAEQIEKDLSAQGVEYDPDARYWVTKEDGSWVYSVKKKDENPDIADVYNTVLKMAKKRSELDAVINVTGCSTLFTQDVEDFPDYDGVTDRSKNPDNPTSNLMTEEQFGQIMEFADRLPKKSRNALADKVSNEDVTYEAAERMIHWLELYADTVTTAQELQKDDVEIPDRIWKELDNASMKDGTGTLHDLLSELSRIKVENS